MAWKDPSILSPAELAYIAGIVDGEGSICIFPFYARPHQRNGVRYLRHQVSISIVNTNRAMLDWIAERLGGPVREVKRARQDWKQTYVWECRFNQAAIIARSILPYLVAKKEQAEILLEFQATGRRSGTRTPPEVLQQRVRLSERIAFLNNRKRGAPKYAVEAKRRAEAHAQSEHASETTAVVQGG